MATKMINNILQKNWNPATRGYPQTANNVYFFLRRELDVGGFSQFVVAKRENRIRHCIPYNGRYLDYVVKKEFPTIHDWVADCGDIMENVLIGSNRTHQGKPPRFTPIRNFLGLYFDYDGPLEDLKVEIPQTTAPMVTTTELTELLDMEMKFRGLSVDNVWVIHNGLPVQWKKFVSTV